MRFADLHIHSTASDGTWTPREVVRFARDRGFSCIALADHDTVGGVAEALQAGDELGIEVIPAVELSTLYREAEVHILGYCIDYRSAELQAQLQVFADARRNRGRRMVEKLRDLGFDISWEEVKSIAGEGSVGRPHVARALLAKGYIGSIKEAFTPEFIGKGGRAYVERYKMRPEEAIKVIKDAGGVAVVAHPGIYKDMSGLERDDIDYLVQYGLQGMEVWHTEHSEDVSAYYEGMAREMGLLLTGGSDCHGHNKEETLLGKIRLPYRYVEELKKKALGAEVR